MDHLEKEGFVFVCRLGPAYLTGAFRTGATPPLAAVEGSDLLVSSLAVKGNAPPIQQVHSHF